MGAFYNPTNGGNFDLGTTQVNKVLNFKSTAGVFSASATIVLLNGSVPVQTNLIGAGLSITGTNIQGTEKTLSLTLNGSDFSNYQGHTLIAQCTLFNEGDVEVIFKLVIR